MVCFELSSATNWRITSASRDLTSGSTGLKCLRNFPSVPSVKEHYTVSLKFLVLIGKKSSVTSRICFFRGTISSIPTSTWTGPASSYMVMRPGSASMDTAGITVQIKNRLPLALQNFPTRSISQLGWQSSQAISMIRPTSRRHIGSQGIGWEKVLW